MSRQISETELKTLVEPFEAIPPRPQMALAYLCYCQRREFGPTDYEHGELSVEELKVRASALNCIDGYLRGETEFFVLAKRGRGAEGDRS
jgi:hypothetical protein